MTREVYLTGHRYIGYVSSAGASYPEFRAHYKGWQFSLTIDHDFETMDGAITALIDLFRQLTGIPHHLSQLEQRAPRRRKKPKQPYML
jgi:hypothetical protein